MTLTFSCDLLTAFIDTDRCKLTQVLRNLISNGLKFTPKGGQVTVSVKLVDDGAVTTTGVIEQKAGNQKSYVVAVTDTGVGISKVCNGYISYRSC